MMLLTSPKLRESLVISVSAVILIGLAIMDIILIRFTHQIANAQAFPLEVCLEVDLGFFVTALQYGCVTGQGHGQHHQTECYQTCN